MELSIQERLKNLHVERGLTLEQAAMAFICKRFRLNYGKLSEKEKKCLKRIVQKSDLLKNPKPSGGEDKRTISRNLRRCL